jgi:hypothetical protein
MEKYRVLYFLQQDIGRLHDALNDAAAEGYLLKFLLLDQAQRTIAVLELQEKKVRKPRTPKE